MRAESGERKPESKAVVAQVADDRVAMLALVARGEITTTLTPKELRAIERELDAALTSAVVVGSTLRAACGAEIHGLPAHLYTMTGMGAGYLRHARDVIRALRKARGKKGKQ